ncbi:scy1-like protein 2 [Plakobranchus ocellatus]|uniref:Scy1-like protein 2 n=1 Tax=Plakobranchus ocellatus TaxID=259542 RepID=A0AAV4A1F9_9GAST|nr:scy1-like protein 2 [Plakobranchus ocellatus]
MDGASVAQWLEASVFVFEKKIADKLHKPRRREVVAETLRKDVWYLEKLKHPKILTVLHGLEECHIRGEIGSMTVNGYPTICLYYQTLWSTPSVSICLVHVFVLSFLIKFCSLPSSGICGTTTSKILPVAGSNMSPATEVLA